MATSPPSTDDFQPPRKMANTAKVEVTVVCRNLSNEDELYKSDLMCILYTAVFGTVDFIKHGQIRGVKGSLESANQKTDTFTLRYFFEECQRLCFTFLNLASVKNAVEKEEFNKEEVVGSRVHCTLGEIIGAPDNTIIKPLYNHNEEVTGELILSAREIGVDQKDFVSLTMRGHKLDKKDFLSKSDPFLVFYQRGVENSYEKIHTTEVMKNTLDPEWRPFHLMLHKVSSLKVECYDYDKERKLRTNKSLPLTDSHDFIGEFITNLAQLSEGGTTYFELINPKKKSQKKSYKNSGTIELVNFHIDIQPCFLDHIKGTQLTLAVAIDFTESNGDPSNSDSLHYIGSTRPTQYIQAVRSVGIVQDYDTDKLFPVFGFGAKVPGEDEVSHAFPVNFDYQNPFCAGGVPGISDAYHDCVNKVQLSGPRNVSPVIDHVAELVTGSDGSKYFILLIITNGAISDMELTKDAMIRASSLPISIIIVGVGEANFDAMEAFDTSKGPLTNNGKTAHRDIVQFVAFRKYMSGPASDNVLMRQARIAKSVLAQVPDQILAYMKNQGIHPKTEPLQKSL